MNFTYENQGNNTYLVYEIKSDDYIDSMGLGMLTNNKIPGFAQTFFTQMDTNRFIKYNISSKISLKQYFEGTVNKKSLIGIFSSILDGLFAAEDYMLDIGSIVFDLNYIFADISNCEALLICLPINVNGIGTTDIGLFFKNIMFSTRFDQTENCDYIAKIINFLNSSPSFSLLDFKNLIASIKSENFSANDSHIQQMQFQKVSTPVQDNVSMPIVTQTSQKPASITTSAPKAVTPPTKQQPTVSPAQMPAQTSAKTSTQASIRIPNRASNQGPARIPASPVPNQPVQPVNDEKKISMFDLLMHYSKENVEIYKSQKASKKSKQSSPIQQQSSPQSQPFSIPKTSDSTNFAIPNPINTPARPINQPEIQQIDSVGSVSGVYQSQVQSIPQQQFTSPVQQGGSMNFGDTTVLSNMGNVGDTTVLSEVEQQVTPHLIRKKNNEKIILNKPVFRIGALREYVDYCVSDNSAVSKSHANIISRDGQYFIIDTNSRNHTYINGGMIQSNIETKISHGDNIRLANEDFEFKLY